MFKRAEESLKKDNGVILDATFVTQELRRRAAGIAAIAGVVVPQLISTGLDLLGNALRKAGEEDTQSYICHLNFDAPPDKPESCIQVVRGNFMRSRALVKSGLVKPQGMRDEEVANRLTKLQIYISDRPQFFLELRVRQSADGSALALAPSYLEYNSLLKTGKLPSNPPKRGLAVQLSFHKPGVKPDGNEAVGAPLVLGNFHAGTHRSYLSTKIDNISDWRPEKETIWFPHYGAKVAAAEKAGKDKDQVRSGRDSALPKRPFTLTAIITEVRDANKLLLAMANLFDAAKPTLQTELEKLALESKRKEAELTQLQTESTNSTAYYNAWVDAETKILTYCKESKSGDTADDKKDRLTKSKDARVAQLDANVKALTAGLPTPYTKLISVSDAKDLDSCP